MNTKKALQLTGLISAAALLTPSTLVFGAAPMLVIRRTYGRAWFALPLLAVAFGFLALGSSGAALLMALAAVLIGVYCEVEEHGSTEFNSAAVGVLASLGAAALAIGAFLWWSKAGLLGFMRTWADKAIAQFTAMNENLVLDPNDLIQQIPSVLIIALFITLWLALVWERPVRTLFRLDPGPDTKPRMLSFRVPDLGIWILIAAIAGGFLHHGNTTLQVVSLNVLNVMAAIYFFQGLAVVASAFRMMKVGPVWRAVWYVIFVLYLNLLVSLVGIVDFWVDFRARMARKPRVQARNEF